MILTKSLRIAFLVGVATILCLVFAPSASAMSPIYTLKELTDSAQVIVIGEVADLWTEGLPDGMIHTYATIAPSDWLKGKKIPKLAVQVQGGEVGEIGLWVSEAPRYQLGQQVLLFLEGGDPFQVVAWKQGKYAIHGELLDNGLRLEDVTRGIKSIVSGGARLGLDRAARLSLDSASRMRMVHTDLAHSQLSYLWQGHHWPGDTPADKPFYVYANTTDTQGALEAVKAALETWSSVDCSKFAFIYGGPTTRAAPLLDGYNVLRWNDLGSGPLGVAYTWYYTSDMSIFESDVVLNDYYTWSAAPECPYNRVDVQNVATHELGHSLGLKDLYDPIYSERTMYGYCGYGETKKRTLHEGDIAGVQAIYPGPCSAPIVPVEQVRLQIGYRLGSGPQGMTVFSSVTWYPQGSEVTLDEAPQIWQLGESSYAFDGWYVDGEFVQGNPITVLMDDSHTVMACYEPT